VEEALSATMSWWEEEDPVAGGGSLKAGELEDGTSVGSLPI